jgi:hypothetical protein
LALLYDTVSGWADGTAFLFAVGSNTQEPKRVGVLGRLELVSPAKMAAGWFVGQTFTVK